MDPSTSLRFAQGSLAKAIDPGSLSAVEVTLRQLDYMHDDVTGSLSAVEVCLIFSTCMKKWPLRRCSGILGLAYGTFDFTAFRSGILGLAYGPFDITAFRSGILGESD